MRSSSAYCEKLDLATGDRVIEIGTGWAGFALHAAATRGCHVTTTTISREQYDYALTQVQRAGLSDRVSVLMEDYRDLRGRYDKLVSIEMIEAVGWNQIGDFFAKCSELLAPHGTMLLQAITIDDRAYEVEKSSNSFMNSYIFPGGCLPSLEVITRKVARRTDLQAVHLDDMTPHYVETLRRWRENHRQRLRLRDLRVRRALPAPVDALPRLLRSRIRRAPDMRYPARPRKAALCGRCAGWTTSHIDHGDRRRGRLTYPLWRRRGLRPRIRTAIAAHDPAGDPGCSRAERRSFQQHHARAPSQPASERSGDAQAMHAPTDDDVLGAGRCGIHTAGR